MAAQVTLSQEEIDFHKCKEKLAKRVIDRVMNHDDHDDHVGMAPPTQELGDHHFQRRAVTNEALVACEDYLSSGNLPNTHEIIKGQDVDDEDGLVHPAVTAALEAVVKSLSADESKQVQKIIDDHKKLKPGAEFRAMSMRSTRFNTAAAKSVRGQQAPPTTSARSQRFGGASTRKPTGQSQPDAPTSYSADPSLKSLHRSVRNATIAHDEVNKILKSGHSMANKVSPSEEKPVLKDPLGIQCVKHLTDKRWTSLARTIRGTIYDPDFYDDGTYAPMYVRLAIHAAATYDKNDGSGGNEGGCMRYRPEYSDAHNKFCKPIIKRQHEMIKLVQPWASYADIQVLCAYVAIECAGGPVIEFTPGRRDVVPHGKHFAYLNYRVRGDTGPEDEFAPCPPAKRKSEEQKNACPPEYDFESNPCPFLVRTTVPPGRVPGPEEGFYGPPMAPVPKANEEEEWRHKSADVRKIFIERMGVPDEKYVVALIGGGHSFGRCHNEISGYAGPWTETPGTFTNLALKRMLNEEWKLVDRSMEDCSGDLITGVKPKGMRRQYVNRNGKGDIMMLPSDMSFRQDPQFRKYVQMYCDDFELMKRDFAIAFKFATELGSDLPKKPPGKMHQLKCFMKDAMRWIGNVICPPLDDDGDDGDGEGAGGGGGPARFTGGDAYKMEDVAKHTSEEDVWLVINGAVCNMTDFKKRHPGGVAIIMKNAGKDASTEWNGIHAPDTIEKIAPEVRIGHIPA